MRNINKMSEKKFLTLNVIGLFLFMLMYRGLIFCCLIFQTFNYSKIILWIMSITITSVGYFLTRKRRRNYLSLFVNISLPFEIYTLMTHEYIFFEFIAIIFIVSFILCILYFSAVLLRHLIKNDKILKLKFYKNMSLHIVNGFRTICAVCFSVLLIYAAVDCVFEPTAIMPSIKSSNEIVENKNDIISENMKHIYKIDTNTWANLSIEERLDLLQILANTERIILGISHEISVCSDNLGFGTYGSYDFNTHKVWIDLDVINDDTANKSIETLCHEIYHGYEHDFVNAFLSLDKEYQQLSVFDEVRKYKENFDNYQTGYDDFETYYNQIVEVDSRAYGKKREAFYFAEAEKYIQVE